MDDFAESKLAEFFIRTIKIIVYDHVVVCAGLFGVLNLDQRRLETLLHGIVGVCSTASETCAEGGYGRRGDKKEDRVEIRLFDLADALWGVRVDGCGGSENVKEIPGLRYQGCSACPAVRLI